MYFLFCSVIVLNGAFARFCTEESREGVFVPAPLAFAFWRRPLADALLVLMLRRLWEQGVQIVFSIF